MRKPEKRMQLFLAIEFAVFVFIAVKQSIAKIERETLREPVRLENPE
jgi:hypothetical protein